MTEQPAPDAPGDSGSASDSGKGPCAEGSHAESARAEGSHAETGARAETNPTAQTPPPAVPLNVWTVPNLLSFARFFGIPLFLYLLLGPQADGWALAVLAISAVTDWADGKLARLLGQYSKLGEILDPAADRLYIVATLVGFAIRGIIPWWAAAIIIGRDLILMVFLPLIARHGYPPPKVLYIGKAATFALLYALPIILLGHAAPAIETASLAIGYAFFIWGTALYVWVGLLYARSNIWILRHTPVVAPSERPNARDVATS